MNSQRPFDPDDHAVLVRYYAGTSSAAERTYAEALITQMTNEQIFAEAFLRQVVHGVPQPTTGEMEAGLARWRQSQAHAARANPLRAPVLPLESSKGRTLLTRIVRMLFDELPNRAIALIEGRDTELKTVEIERLRSLVEQTDREEE